MTTIKQWGLSCGRWCRDYSKAIAGTFLWYALITSCYMVPDRFTYVYVIIWSGAATVTTGVFVLGYMRFSKPSKDPVTHKRNWQGIWAWILAQAAVVLLVVGLSFALRLINIESAIFTEDRVMQYQFTAAVFVTVFLEQLWLTIYWVRRQIEARRGPPPTIGITLQEPAGEGT
jgi:magnesium-transporting ATPase (P-type)